MSLWTVGLKARKFLENIEISHESLTDIFLFLSLARSSLSCLVKNDQNCVLRPSDPKKIYPGSLNPSHLGFTTSMNLKDVISDVIYSNRSNHRALNICFYDALYN